MCSAGLMHALLTTDRSRLTLFPQYAWFRATLMFISLATTAALPNAEAGKIYKSIDSQGNIVFTDQPPLNESEPADGQNNNDSASQNRKRHESDPQDDEIEDDEIEPAKPPATVLVAPVPTDPPNTEVPDFDEPVEFLPVTRMEILTPDHDTTIVDPLGQVWVEVQSYPTPMSRTGFTAELMMDGQLVTRGVGTVLRLPPPPRGTHVLQVRLIDKAGRLVQKSNTVHIHIKYRFAEQ